MARRSISAAVTVALLSASALLAAGCKVGPDFKAPAAPETSAYTPDSARAEAISPDITVQRVNLGAEIQGNWWTLFRSQAIDSVVSEALAHNQTLAASVATLEQTQEYATASKGARFPQINMTAGVGRQKYGEEFLGGLARPFSFTYFAVGPTVSYMFDPAGGIERNIERQYAAAESRKHQLDAAYLTVTGQAVMQALAIASTRAQIVTLEKLLDEDRENLKLVETAFNNGSVARIDVLAARSGIIDDQTLMPPLHQELSKAQHALSVVIGRPPSGPLPADFLLDQITLPLELPVSLPSELVHRRPDILAAESDLHAATATVGVATSNLYPKIQLSATAVVESLTPGQLFDRRSVAWSLLSGITQPVFAGGMLRAQQRATVAYMHASAANYQETVLEAFGQVADLLEALNHDAEELDAQNQAQEGAAGRLELTRASYTEGNSGVLQVLDAERSYQRARLGYVRAVAQRYIDTVQLFLALGGTSPADAAASARLSSRN